MQVGSVFNQLTNGALTEPDFIKITVRQNPDMIRLSTGLLNPFLCPFGIGFKIVSNVRLDHRGILN